MEREANDRTIELEREREEVARAQAGDRQALGAILHRYGPKLFRAVLLPRLGSEAAAEEALSITYSRVVEKLDQFTWQSVGIYPWLRVVAMRIALDMLRARKREVPLDAEDLARVIDRAQTNQESQTDALTLAREDADVARDHIERALAGINPRYATVIRLRILEEKSREEVAIEIGVSTSTFDVILHRAMAAMRKALRVDPRA
jgi:RNA polymerase sigma factor (sigma-70 family)